ncbi:CBO0543 family protein [Paenibacillus aestuarii]|uniref:CBO0543 family protein n=1 Tax=Paenibacillus aestuarii TaxID=516965 RepID=A0ABW0K8L8_9BACL|nr:CBO0543 family protein [Paenibacillus aestuarii]
MHFALAVFIVIVVWARGVWREWSTFHHTMMFFALGNVTYNFITANYFLWKMKPDIFPNHSITELVYTFVIFPATALLFLAKYPVTPKKIVLHNLIWIAIYAGFELLFFVCGRMVYQHGWNLWWSIIFDITMFPILRLHFKRPLMAYTISVFLCIFWIWMFHVPVNVPIENRGG